MKIADVFIDITERKGLGVIATDLEISESQVGAVKNNERGLSLRKMDQFLEMHGFSVISKAREDELITAACIAFELLKEKTRK